MADSIVAAEMGSTNLKPVQPEPSLVQPQQHQTQNMQTHDLTAPHIPSSISTFSGPSVVPLPFHHAPQFSHIVSYPSNPITAAPVPPPGIVPQVSGSIPSIQYHIPIPGQPPNPVIRAPFVPIHNGFATPLSQGSVVPPVY